MMLRSYWRVCVPEQLCGLPTLLLLVPVVTDITAGSRNPTIEKVAMVAAAVAAAAAAAGLTLSPPALRACRREHEDVVAAWLIARALDQAPEPAGHRKLRPSWPAGRLQTKIFLLGQTVWGTPSVSRDRTPREKNLASSPSPKS